MRLLVSSTEIGQGTRTMHAQIVAETLGIPYARIATADPDTARVPDSGPTVASRTCMVVGKILQRAAEKLRAELGDYDGEKEFLKRARRLLADRGTVEVIEEYQKPGDIAWSDETYEGDAYGAYAWGCNIADVEIDPITYQARCTQFTTAIDIGKAIHPILAEGQIEGGTLQGIGWALYEDVVMRDGRDAERVAHQLHHPDDARHAADRRRDRRASVRQRAVRRQGRRRVSDRRAGGGDRQRHPRGDGQAARRGAGHAGAHHEGDRMKLRLHVNGKKHSVDVPPMKRLLDTLREDLALTGTKEGCGEGECGACTVLVDGAAVNACLVPTCQVDGCEVRTVEGIAGAGGKQAARLHRLQRAFLEHGAAQCGICTPGMLMAALALPRRASLDEIRAGLAGNLCRCTGYMKIYDAVAQFLDGERAVIAADGDRRAASASPQGRAAHVARRRRRGPSARSRRRRHRSVRHAQRRAEAGGALPRSLAPRQAARRRERRQAGASGSGRWRPTPTASSPRRCASGCRSSSRRRARSAACRSRTAARSPATSRTARPPPTACRC